MLSQHFKELAKDNSINISLENNEHYFVCKPKENFHYVNKHKLKPNYFLGGISYKMHGSIKRTEYQYKADQIKQKNMLLNRDYPLQIS